MIVLLNNVTTSTDGKEWMTDEDNRDYLRPVQVVISGVGTVTVQGRCDPSLPWIDIKSYTSSGADTVQVFRCMRARSTSQTSGTVSVWLDARQAISTN